jgi:hypothetical protein
VYAPADTGREDHERKYMKTIMKISYFGLVLATLRLMPLAQAVSPAPDGGYPHGNTAEGQSALLSLDTGAYNTGLGFLSLRGLTAANFNTAVGAGTLLVTAADNNTAVGRELF